MGWDERAIWGTKIVWKERKTHESLKRMSSWFASSRLVDKAERSLSDWFGLGGVALWNLFGGSEAYI